MLAEKILLTAMSGSVIDFYRGSTDEVALRCIAYADSLLNQLDNIEEGAPHEDTQRVTQGDVPVMGSKS